MSKRLLSMARFDDMTDSGVYNRGVNIPVNQNVALVTTAPALLLAIK